MKENTEILKNVSILSQLSPEEIDTVVKCFREESVPKGKILFNQGDKGESLYIIKSGTLCVLIKISTGELQEIATFREGDFFGEMSIFEQAPRSATCKSKTDSVVFSLKGSDFFSIIEKNPEIAIKMMYKMLNETTVRLDQTSGFLSDMVHWGEDARKRAITDQMTGLYNRRYLDDAFKELFQKAVKAQSPLSVIMVDLDHFREINELYSHEVGDKAIGAVVEVYKRYLPKDAIICRYGGDEFTIILPDTDAVKAFGYAQLIRCDVEKVPFLHQYEGPIQQVTLSMGVSNYPENGEDLQLVKEAADKALYTAKESGRNRVVLA